LHLNDLRYMGFDFLARNIHLRASIVFDDVGTITITGYLLCGGRRCKDGFEGLLIIEIFLKFFKNDEPE